MSTKTAFEIFVDDAGMAHDDEGNSWFVGRQYAGTYPGTGRLPFPLGGGDDDDRPSSSYRPRPVNQNQLKALQELSAKKPGEFTKSLTSQVERGFALSQKQRDIVVRMLADARMIEAVQHFDWTAYNKLKSAVQPNKNNPHLDALDSLLRRKQDNFVQSLRDQVARGRRLTENQAKVLRSIFYRNSMKAEAELFREASAARVASLYNRRTI